MLRKMISKEKLIEEMVKTKGDEDNIIDLQAYCKGLEEMYDKLNNSKRSNVDTSKMKQV